MNPNLVIECNHVSKSFSHAFRLKGSDTQALSAVFAEALGRRRRAVGKNGVFLTTQATGKLFDDFNLAVDEGSVVGLVGPSGSGKSVLLKLVAGVIPIDAGRITVRGSVSSLLDETESLNGNATIRENIIEYCRLNRIERASADNFYERVISFAELGKFTETPIRHFSTGMYMRLRVAIALEREADIFLIDDVLGVGDLNFQNKCLDRLSELSGGDATIVVVMHDEALLDKIATRIVRLSGGAITADTPISQSALLTSRRSTFGQYESKLSQTFAENEYVMLSAVELKQRQENGKEVLGIEAQIDIRLPQKLRPTLDIRIGDRVAFRSVYPEDTAVEAGTKVRYVVDLPLWLLGWDTYVVDFNFVSVDGGGAHSLKTKGLLSIVAKNSAADEQRNVEAGILNPDFACTMTEISESA